MAEKTSLFSITCGTCDSKLQVRSSSAIGQVLACPKCRSMVKVEAPEGWVPPDDTPPPLPRRPRDPNDSQATLTGDFGDLRSVGTPLPQTPRSKPAPKPVLPTDAWESDNVRVRRKNVVLYSGLAAISLIASGLIIWLIVAMTGGSGQTQLAGGNGAGDTDLPADNAEPEGDAKSQLGSDPESTTAPPETDTGADAEPGSGDPDENEAETQSASTDSESGSDDNDANAGDDTPTSVETTPDDLEPDTPESITDSGHDQPRENELVDIDQSLQDSGITMGPRPEDGILTGIDDLRELFAEPSVDAALIDIGEAPQDRVMGTAKIYVPKPEPMELDADESLNDALPGFALNEASAWELLRRLTAISGVAIQLDAHDILYGNVDITQRLSVDATDKSVLEILTEAFAATALAPTRSADVPVVVVRDKERDNVAERTLVIDNVLASDDATRREVADLIKLVTGSELWEGESAAHLEVLENSFVVTSSGELFDEVAFLVSLLQRAAAVREAGPGAGEATMPATLASRSALVLKKPTTLHQQQRLPLFELLRMVEETEGLVILVDWQSVTPLGWNPMTTVNWPADGEPVEQVLTDLTSSMELAWRMVAPGVVEVTSREMYQNGTRYEFYDCEPALQRFDKEQILRILQERMAPRLGNTEAWTRVEFVEDLNGIVACLPDSLHIQLEQLLVELAR